MFGDRGRLAAAVSCMLAACSTVDNQPVQAPSTKLDETVFRCSVQPILARQCSYTACHGNAISALRVYTPGKLRATPPKNVDEATAALSDAEQHANYLSATGFAFGTENADDNFLLRKPLPGALGGYEHKGGAIYSGGTTDPQYMTIRAWLTGTGKCK